MNHKLTPGTIFLLVVPPLLWSGNAIVGRLIHELVPPITLNFIRWALAFVILLPMAFRIYRQGSTFWSNWRRYAVLGLLGVGMYNALQYMALQTSSPMNVTLVAASMPVWMLMVGRLFFHSSVTRWQLGGAVFSIAGVLVVLSRGDLQQLLGLRLVAGDLFMIVATITWSVYSWLLTRGNDGELRRYWADFLLAQVTFGVLWSAAFSATEWTLTKAVIHWSPMLIAAMLFVAIGPAVIAFRCWGAGVQRVGPNVAAFFNNLTPLFAAVMSSLILGEAPHVYHGLAFLLILGGIVLSARR